MRVFAGKEKTRRVGDNEFATGEYTILKAYDGPVAFSVPGPRQGGFTALAKSNASQFLEMVAAAKGEFVVVQSARGGKAANIVAVYRFNSALVPVLLSCAKAQHLAAAAPDGPALSVSAAGGSEGWRTYANARFGTTIEFPGGIFSSVSPRRKTAMARPSAAPTVARGCWSTARTMWKTTRRRATSTSTSTRRA